MGYIRELPQRHATRTDFRSSLGRKDTLFADDLRRTIPLSIPAKASTKSSVRRKQANAEQLYNDTLTAGQLRYSAAQTAAVRRGDEVDDAATKRKKLAGIHKRAVEATKVPADTLRCPLVNTTRNTSN